MDDISQTHAGVCDKDVKVYIPNPVVLPSPNDTFDHVKLQPCGASFRMRFVVNIKVITMETSIIFEQKVEPRKLVNASSCEFEILRTIFVSKSEMHV